jgi:hypothetical protein
MRKDVFPVRKEPIPMCEDTILMRKKVILMCEDTIPMRKEAILMRKILFPARNRSFLMGNLHLAVELPHKIKRAAPLYQDSPFDFLTLYYFNFSILWL